MSAPTCRKPRWLPTLPLPPYRYVPGQEPHPFRDPRGHNHNAQLHWSTPPWSPELQWSENEHYLHGIDLFEYRFFWEAHEVWEDVWRAVPRGTPAREAVQGLILWSAAALKNDMGHATVAARMWSRACVHFATAGAHGAAAWGLQIDLLRHQPVPFDNPSLVSCGLPTPPSCVTLSARP